MKVKCIEELSYDKKAFTVGKTYKLVEDEDGIYLSINKYLVRNNFGNVAAYPKEIFEIENEMKVYFDGDSEWWASSWDIEKTKKWIIKEYQLDNDVELEECNLDRDGMWYETDSLKDITTLGDYDESCKGGIGDLRRGIEDKTIVEKLMSFREVLKRQGSSKKPYVIATTNY